MELVQEKEMFSVLLLGQPDLATRKVYVKLKLIKRS